MKRKNNPWLSLAALLLLALILVLTCTGCTGKESAAPSKRFTYERERIGATVRGIVYAAVITDTETGQQYLFVDHGTCGGLTKLEG